VLWLVNAKVAGFVYKGRLRRQAETRWAVEDTRVVRTA